MDQFIHDIFFLSYDEPNAAENWLRLSQKFPNAQKIEGIKGIIEAHKECDNRSKSNHFFVVDGDNEVLPHFSFQFKINEDDYFATHVWRCKNPVNQLVYGYGAIKLFPKQIIREANGLVDLSSGSAKKYKIIHELASITHFNSSPLHSWRAAFRECAKLASQCIPNQQAKETEDRLTAWCTQGIDAPFGRECIAGANAGVLFGKENQNNLSSLLLLNDFTWLDKQFGESEFARA